MPHECITKDLKRTLESFSRCESVSLRISKIVKIPRKGEQEAKSEEIQSIIQSFNRRNITVPKLTFLPPNARQLVLRLKANLIVNQANSILENAGICLHRFFDYPYIPGSAVKGVARHAAWEKWFAEEEPTKKLELAQKIADVFGFPTGDERPEKNASERDYLDDYLWKNSPEKYGTKENSKSYAGTVVFMDAIPKSTDKLCLVADICTSHHPDYYTPGSKRTQALDDEAPNPQLFPVVQSGSAFLFHLIPRKSDADLISAEKFLLDALTINGIGGKTAAGYGWFEEEKSANADDPEIAREVEIIQEEKFGAVKKRLKKETLDEKEKEALKLVARAQSFSTYTLRDLKEEFQTHKGPVYRKLIELLGEEEAYTLFNS